jgi:hypothetical protein
MSGGYRNPPNAIQFKKGRSGNSKGRPKRAMRRISTAYLFRKVANEQVAIEAEGEVMMTRWEAFVRQIHTMALNKDASAARLLYQATKAIPRKSSRGRQAYVCC